MSEIDNGGQNTKRGATHINIPDVDTLIKWTSGKESTIGTESHAIDGLCVPLQCLSARSRCNVPQSHCRVETRTKM